MRPGQAKARERSEARERAGDDDKYEKCERGRDPASCVVPAIKHA